MNILYINHYAGSPAHGMEFRPYYLSKEWIKLGHKVTILSASFSHLRSAQPILKNTRKTIEIIDGIKYVWYPTKSYSENGVKRLFNIAEFLLKVWQDRKNIVLDQSPDVVIASSTYPMDIWIAHKIAKLSGAKLVYEVHDLWPLSPIELGGMSPKHPFIIMCQAAENYAYKNADLVVSMLPCVHEHMASHGLDLSKLIIIPNGVAQEDWSTTEEINLTQSAILNKLQETKQSGKKIIGYAGSHGMPNALDYLLNAVKSLDKEKFTLFLVGDGLEKYKLIEKVEQEKIENVLFFDPIPKTEIPALLENFDICYLGWHKLPLYRFGISPNKLLDYMMAGRPILHSVNAGNDIVSDAKCGFSVDAENIRSIVKGLDKMLDMPKEELEKLGQNGKFFVEKNFTYSVLANKFITGIEELL
ncbi:glycosyltransferase family 4 protein [Pasteurellaceae bacterium TAE3-ERU1]|nr:glycosyltransferase family 4 protein [Pasteurellaceae bacterium TAE3-ERU1]